MPAGLQPGHSVLDEFREGLYRCLARRADVLFELADAVACGSGRVTDLARLSLEPAFRRGHGGLYDGLNAGCIDTDRLAGLVTRTPLPRISGPDGRAGIVLAVDVSNWLRPDAATSPGRSFCHTYPRGKGAAQVIPGWAYSWVVALEAGRTSWTAPLEATRLDPDTDPTMATAAQLRRVVERLQAAGQHRLGDPDILIVMDAGYNVTRLTWLLSDLPVVLVARLRSNRVFFGPPGIRRGPTKGRPPRHGAKLRLAQPEQGPTPQMSLTAPSPRYKSVQISTWDRFHPDIDRRNGWADHPGPVPLTEGTVIGVVAEQPPPGRDAVTVWLWCSAVGADTEMVHHWWAMYQRRFDIEHTFRFCKQTLGWTRPMLRDPEAADRWTWLLIAVHTQLRLARGLVADHRLPWQGSQRPSAVLSPARVRVGYRRVHSTLAHPANPPKPGHPGPGRPPGHLNKKRARIQHVGKTTTG